MQILHSFDGAGKCVVVVVVVVVVLSVLFASSFACYAGITDFR